MAPNVLLTGANGFVGAHVLELLLNSTTPKYTVLAALRSQSKVDAVAATYVSHVSSGQLKFVVVPDITTSGAFDDAFTRDKVDYVVHVASPYILEVTDVESQLLEPAVKGTTRILESAVKAGGVKRVVITSSFAAIINRPAGGAWREGYTYTEADWNPLTRENAVQPGPYQSVIAYGVSKTLAEKAAWDFIKEKTPSFDLVTVNPPMIYGPSAPAQHLSLKSLNESYSFIHTLITGPEIPVTAFPQMADVREVARTHVQALSRPAAGGRRFVLCAATPTYVDMVNFLRKLPELQGRKLAEETEASRMTGKVAAGLDATPASEVLGIVFRSWQETISDSAEELIRLGA